METIGKIFFIISLMLFVSCSSDDDSGVLSGYYTEVEWLKESAREAIANKDYDPDGFCAGTIGFDFSSNTVERSWCYVYAKSVSNAFHTATVSGQTIYFVKKHIGTYDYYIDGNTVIMADGTWGTISDYSFYLEGNRRFTKLK